MHTPGVGPETVLIALLWAWFLQFLDGIAALVAAVSAGKLPDPHWPTDARGHPDTDWVEVRGGSDDG